MVKPAKLLTKCYTLCSTKDQKGQIINNSYYRICLFESCGYFVQDQDSACTASVAIYGQEFYGGN